MPPLSSSEFEFLREYVYKTTGNKLGPEKAYLIEARLSPVLTDEKLAGFGNLVARIVNDPGGPVAQKVREAMMTHETSFFRDVAPFQSLKTTVLPTLFERRNAARELRIWSAACSTGQEPYTIAMMLREEFPLQAQAWNIRIVATDISTSVLAKAKEGTFSQIEVDRGLPVNYRLKYFNRTGTHWRVNDDIRKMVDFRILNLTEQWPQLGPQDVILIRNVMIYFTMEARRDILGRVKRILRPDGYLFLGGAETTLNIDESFERATQDRGSSYKLRDTRPAAMAG